MNQNQFVLNHLIDHGYMTQTIGNNYGVRRVGARIWDLKVAGIGICTVNKVDDAGVRYAYYYLTDSWRETERNRRTKGLTYRIGVKAAA
jgi:hypothetical protein